MNKLKTLTAFSAIGMSIAALAATPAFGSEFESLHVTVPFSFTAGKTVMPAGEYTVYENESHLVMIRGDKGSVLLLGAPGTEQQDEKSSLSFDRTSKGFELRSIHSAGRPDSVIPAVVKEK
jgi:hypothetical protein